MTGRGVFENQNYGDLGGQSIDAGTETAKQSMGASLSDAGFASRLHIAAAAAHREGRLKFEPRGDRDTKSPVDLDVSREGRPKTVDPVDVALSEVDAGSPGQAETLPRKPVNRLSRAVTGL